MICPTDKKFGGGVVDDRFQKLLQNQLTEIDDDSITSLKEFAFRGNTQLISISLPNLTTVPQYAFYSLSNLVNINLPKVYSVSGQYAFSSCTKLTFVYMPSLRTSTSREFRDCTRLVTAHLPKITTLSGEMFYGCSSLVNLIIDDKAQIASSATSTFTNSPFKGAGGTVYTNYENVASYPSYSYWGAAGMNVTFLSIQEHLVDLQTLGVDITNYYEIVDELPTSDISTTKVYLIETATAGTYAQHYYNGTAWSTNLPDIIL